MPTNLGRTLTSLLLLATLLPPLVTLTACGPSPEELAADREEIEELLHEYARLLGRAYAFADPSVLDPVATRREMASVENNVARLAADGRRLAVDLRELTIEDLNLFQANNAYVRTFEVWDIRVLATGVEEEISRQDGQQSRVRYHVKRNDETGDWEVVWRQRLDESSPE